MGSAILRVASLRVASLRVASLRVASLRVASLRVASLRVCESASLRVASLPVASLPVASLPVASLPVASLPVASRRILAWSQATIFLLASSSCDLRVCKYNGVYGEREYHKYLVSLELYFAIRYYVHQIYTSIDPPVDSKCVTKHV